RAPGPSPRGSGTRQPSPHHACPLKAARPALATRRSLPQSPRQLAGELETLAHQDNSNAGPSRTPPREGKQASYTNGCLFRLRHQPHLKCLTESWAMPYLLAIEAFSGELSRNEMSQYLIGLRELPKAVSCVWHYDS